MTSQAESLYAFVTRTASNAPIRRLLELLVAAAAIAAGILVTGPQRWPVAAAAGAIAAIALWGIAAHRGPGGLTRAAQGLLLVVGWLLAIAAGVGLLFWVLGPRWML